MDKNIRTGCLKGGQSCWVISNLITGSLIEITEDRV